ncbi:hypothetical protein L1887_31588 [Cichorium endivia]|nr:hypothetical protein L1887_31588 [Cichorium endivia]
MINHDHHPHRKHPNDVIERLHLRISNNPDSQPASTNNESTYNDEHLRDPYSNTMNMNSTQTSPVASSKWSYREQAAPDCMDFSDYTGLLASLVRQEGNIYSLAAIGDMLYTGSDSKNIRVWKNRKEFSGFKSNSGLVKAIVIADDTIFTGHSDGKIRAWKVSAKNPRVHKKISTLPNLTSIMEKSMKPKNYTECLAVDMSRRDGSGERPFTLYSGSLDRSVKIWRVSAETPEIDDQQPRRPSHQKDRLRRTHDGGFQTFSAQGRLNQRRK